MLGKRIITVNIEADSVRLLSTKGKSVETWLREPLEPGIVKDGLILKPDAVGRAIASALEKARLPSGNISLSITGRHSTFRILTLPQTKASLLDEAVRWAARDEMPVPLDELHLSWQPIAARDGEQDIFVLGIPRELIDAAIETQLTSHLKPAVIDFKPLALARLAGRPKALIIDLERDAFGITLVSDGVPSVIRTIVPRWDEQLLEEILRRLNEEITRIVEYHNRGRQRSPVGPETPVFLTGALANDESVTDPIAQALSYPIESLPQPLKCPPDFPLATYAVNVGLARRDSAAARKNKVPERDGFKDVTLNLVPREFGPQPVQLRYVFFALVPMLAVAGLFPVYKALETARDETVRLEWEYEDLNFRIDQINDARTAIADVEKEIDKLNKEAAALERVYDAATSVGSIHGSTTNLILSLLPEDVVLTTISSTSDGIVLNGSSENPISVIGFTKALELREEFSSVYLTSLGGSFTIVIDR